MRCYLQDSQIRIFPSGNRHAPVPSRAGMPTLGPARSHAGRWLRLDAAAGERLSFQVAVENLERAESGRVTLAAGAPEGLSVRIRRVGFVPVAHHSTDTPAAELDCRGHVPGYLPDPLYDENEAVVPGGETAAFWVSVRVAPDCRPGRARVTLAVSCQGESVASLSADVTVHPVRIQPRRDFPVTQWFYSDALLDWYGLPGFDRRYWQIVRAYVLNIAEHGQDTLYVPALTPPLDGVKRPTQLLGVRRSAGSWALDWSDVKRYVRLAGSCGIRFFEWPHLFTQWGARNAIRVYQGQGKEEKLLWSPGTRSTSEIYTGFLARYLPELHRFLRAEGIAERSFFHVSDEPHGEEARRNYRAARELLARLAPWMQTMDALSDIAFGREHLTDMPVASIATARDFAAEGLPCWAYFCCGPRGAYINRLLDTPLAKVRMSGWLFYRFGMRGFLHWGLNYWYRSQSRTLIDPFTESAGANWPAWPHGDPFILYPGRDGPIDSIRWEVFSESLADYALLQSLQVDPGGRLLSPLAGFDRFPRSRRWLKSARRTLLSRA